MVKIPSTRIRISPPALNMIVLDIETTGLDPKKNSILSIGALEFENPNNQFYGECRVDKNSVIDPVALKINGFSLSEILDVKKKSSEELIKEFIKWVSKIKNKSLAGDNIWFDTKFMKENLKRLKIKWPFGEKNIELHELPEIKGKFPWSLDVLLEYVGIPPRRETHNALNDVKLEAETISRIMNGKNLIKEFSKYPLPEYLKKNRVNTY